MATAVELVSRKVVASRFYNYRVWIVEFVNIAMLLGVFLAFLCRLAVRASHRRHVHIEHIAVQGELLCVFL